MNKELSFRAKCVHLDRDTIIAYRQTNTDASPKTRTVQPSDEKQEKTNTQKKYRHIMASN